MLAAEVNHIVKSYADKAVVNDLSLSVAQGEIFGLIGPNGAGKTTTIRMMMDIIKPDSGDVTILGEKLSEASKNKLGYLPEERGLYRKLTVIDSIIYLASLKGMDRHSAEEKANELLNQTGMLPHKRKKIEELSQGMGQIIQFIVTIIHDPELVILDEPFSGLDPVNTELLKRMFVDLRNQGKAVILSTHRMNEVEELCDRILMMNNGRTVLYGNLTEIKSSYRSNSVLLESQGKLGEVPGVTEKRTHKGCVELVLDGNTTPQQLLERLVSRGIVINRFEVATPPLNEIFLKVVGKNYE
ncbi:MAG: ATP-binding cassette domain-containing protein [Dehalococcoidia bacterium]|nr:MAG: ATP-binding cassette domain-containing protein [Dehalococcoidia bacterium]